MNNKYIFSFVFLVILTAVSLLFFNIQTPNSEDLYQGSDEEISVKTTTTLAPTTTTTTTVPVNISEDEESLQIVEDEDVDEQLLYDVPYLSFA